MKKALLQVCQRVSWSLVWLSEDNIRAGVLTHTLQQPSALASMQHQLTTLQLIISVAVTAKKADFNEPGSVNTARTTTCEKL